MLYRPTDIQHVVWVDFHVTVFAVRICGTAAAAMEPEFEGVEEALKKLPEEDRKEVWRILYGRELP